MQVTFNQMKILFRISFVFFQRNCIIFFSQDARRNHLIIIIIFSMGEKERETTSQSINNHGNKWRSLSPLPFSNLYHWSQWTGLGRRLIELDSCLIVCAAVIIIMIPYTDREFLSLNPFFLSSCLLAANKMASSIIIELMMIAFICEMDGWKAELSCVLTCLLPERRISLTCALIPITRHADITCIYIFYKFFFLDDNNNNNIGRPPFGLCPILLEKEGGSIVNPQLPACLRRWMQPLYIFYIYNILEKKKRKIFFLKKEEERLSLIHPSVDFLFSPHYIIIIRKTRQGERLALSSSYLN